MTRNTDLKTGNIRNIGNQVVTNETDGGFVEGNVHW